MNSVEGEVSRHKVNMFNNMYQPSNKYYSNGFTSEKAHRQLRQHKKDNFVKSMQPKRIAQQYFINEKYLQRVRVSIHTPSEEDSLDFENFQQAQQKISQKQQTSLKNQDSKQKVDTPYPLFKSQLTSNSPKTKEEQKIEMGEIEEIDESESEFLEQMQSICLKEQYEDQQIECPICNKYIDINLMVNYLECPSCGLMVKGQENFIISY